MRAKASSSDSHRARRPRRNGRPTLIEAAQLDEHVRESALRLFLDLGYEKTSMEAIAKAAGTTKVSLYARFPSKEKVFSAVLLWALRRSDWPKREPLRSQEDLEGALRAIAETSFRRAVDPAVVKLSRIAVAHALRFPEIALQTHAAGWSPRHQTLIEVLKHHAAKGTIIADDPEVMAEHFLAMVSAMPARLASFQIVLTAAEQKRRIDVGIEMFLRSLQFRRKGASSRA